MYCHVFELNFKAAVKWHHNVTCYTLCVMLSWLYLIRRRQINDHTGYSMWHFMRDYIMVEVVTMLRTNRKTRLVVMVLGIKDWSWGLAISPSPKSTYWITTAGFIPLLCIVGSLLPFNCGCYGTYGYKSKLKVINVLGYSLGISL